MAKLDVQLGSPEFSSWRACLWPIHRHELKKLLPMLAISFFLFLNYNVLRTLKDTLLVTAKSSGAEVIPFVKVWAMFPGAILMTILYTWMSNRMSQEKVFYIVISIFLSYFFVFTFLLYPMEEFIHPHKLADYLERVLPLGFKGMIAMFRYWTFTIFYVMSELWGNIVLFVLFWGFANQVTHLSEAKRFYGVFGIAGNFSGIIAGQISVYACIYSTNCPLPIGENGWHQSLIMLVGLILISGLLAMYFFRWMNKNVLTDPRFYDPVHIKTEGEVQGKLTLKESIAILLRSRYLLCIALLVVAYNVVINLTEVVWKHQVRELYPNPTSYTLYMNEIVSIIGLVATLSSLLISGNSIRKCGWTFTAMITPAILAVTSIGFFTFFFLKGNANEVISSLLGFSPLAIAVFFGSLQNVLSRGAKYSVFDITKEMTFVPLDPETKLIGKAAIDGVCSRMGKSGGSVIHQGLLLTFSTVAASAPYVTASLFVIIGLWMVLVFTLGKQFNALSRQQGFVLPKPQTPPPAPIPALGESFAIQA